MKVFAFLDLDHPVVAWGAYRGILVSSNAEYPQPQCPVSMMFAGILLHQNNTRLHNELLLEKYRQLHFTKRISRLAGMYFFEDRRTAELASEWGGHFSSENLAEFELFPTETYSRHDSNWISYAPRCESGRIKGENWIAKYWLGEPYPGRTPVWELLVQGRAAICGTELRNRAYNVISNQFPESLSILEISRIAAHVGSDLGCVSAWLVREDHCSFTLSFMLDMRDADQPEFLEKVRQYDGPLNQIDLAIGGENFMLPDFRKFSSTIAVKEGLEDPFIFSIHRNVKI